MQSRADFLEIIKRLPTKAPHFQKSRRADWIRWLTGHEDFPRLDPNRSPRTIYNALSNPEYIIWRAAALGIDQPTIARAVKSSTIRGAQGKKAAAVRKVISWTRIADKLAALHQPARTQKHFVAYQNKDELGPFFHNAAAKKAKEASFFTAKLFRQETLRGAHLWVFEGSGSPKTYSLVCHGTVSKVAREKRPAWYRTPNRKAGTRVKFRIEGSRASVEVTNLPWFKKLLQQQLSFRNGLNSIADGSIVTELKNVLPTLEDGTATDISLIIARVAKVTTRQALIEARLGMGAYRSQLEVRWHNQCAVTGCKLPELLRASHIKPWSVSNNRE